MRTTPSPASRASPQDPLSLSTRRKDRRQLFPKAALCKLIIILGSWPPLAFHPLAPGSGSCIDISATPFIVHLQNTHFVGVTLQPHLTSLDPWTGKRLGFPSLGLRMGHRLVLGGLEGVRQVGFAIMGGFIGAFSARHYQFIRKNIPH